MVAARARVSVHRNDLDPIVPIVVPALDEVRRFAHKLHEQRRAWHGVAFGWHAEYNPSQQEPPLDSKMTFTPADFCIGESGIWFFSMMWEGGDHAAPDEYLDDRAIIGTVAP